MDSENDIPAPRMLTLHEVIDRVGLKKTSVYAFMKTRGFPRPYRLGFQAVRWRSDEVDSWIVAQERGGGRLTAA